MDKQNSAVAFALHAFRDCGIIARDRSEHFFLRRVFQSDHLSRTTGQVSLKVVGNLAVTSAQSFAIYSYLCAL